jgi:hypothetical protein
MRDSDRLYRSKADIGARKLARAPVCFEHEDSHILGLDIAAWTKETRTGDKFLMPMTWPMGIPAR